MHLSGIGPMGLTKPSTVVRKLLFSALDDSDIRAAHDDMDDTGMIWLMLPHEEPRNLLRGFHEGLRSSPFEL
jgi:hypothetical protein